MIITFTANAGTTINAERCLDLIQAALDKTNSFYGGNLRWHEEDGLTVKLLNSVRMRLEGRLLVHDPVKRGAAIIDGERCVSASISANARLVENIHAVEPTAVIQVGNVFYQREVPPPLKKPVVTVPAGTAPAVTHTATVTAITPSTTPPLVAAALAASAKPPMVANAEAAAGLAFTPPTMPLNPTDAEIESYYDAIYGAGGIH